MQVTEEIIIFLFDDIAVPTNQINFANFCSTIYNTGKYIYITCTPLFPLFPKH